MLTSPSGKSYIGQTIKSNVEERWKQHLKPSNKCRAIYNAIQKYGWDNFQKDWYECPDEELNDHEELMVEVLGTLSPNGYNLKEGGANGKPSEESKQKNREAHIGEKNSRYGKTHTEDTINKMKEVKQGDKHPMYGKKHTEETIQKMKEVKQGDKSYWYGKTRSEETKQKHSKSIQGEKNHRSKRVYQYDLGDNFIRSFGSSGEAARFLNKKDETGTVIRMCACGDRKSAHGFKWSYTKI